MKKLLIRSLRPNPNSATMPNVFSNLSKLVIQTLLSSFLQIGIRPPRPQAIMFQSLKVGFKKRFQLLIELEF